MRITIDLEGNELKAESAGEPEGSAVESEAAGAPDSELVQSMSTSRAVDHDASHLSSGLAGNAIDGGQPPQELIAAIEAASTGLSSQPNGSDSNAGAAPTLEG